MSIENKPVCEAVTINHIAITVSNLHRSKEWYCKTFGLRVIQESDQSVLLGFGESMLVLRPDATPGTVSHFMFGLINSMPQVLKHVFKNKDSIRAKIPTAFMFAILTA
jgi:catechol 2,3-dioxygenase-like lactoylglutathione lyase family enzyme